MEKKRKHSCHNSGITLPASRCRRELNKVIRNLVSGAWTRVCITKNKRIVAVVHPYNGNNMVSDFGANTLDSIKKVEGKAKGLLKHVKADLSISEDDWLTYASAADEADSNFLKQREDVLGPSRINLEDEA